MESSKSTSLHKNEGDSRLRRRINEKGEVVLFNEDTYIEDEDPEYKYDVENDDDDDEDEDEDEDDEDEFSDESAFEGDELSVSDSSISDSNNKEHHLEHKKLANRFTSLNSASVSALDLINNTSELLLSSHKSFKRLIHKYEVPRKLFHVSIGFITLYLYTINFQIYNFTIPLFIAFVIILALDLVRFRFPYFNKLYCKSVGFLMREKEVNSYNGVIWYLLGLSIVFAIYPKDVSMISLLLLSWSDTMASTVGRTYGHLTPKLARNKSLAGSIAAFVTGIICCYLFYGYFIPNYPDVNEGYEIMWSRDNSYLNLHAYALVSGFIAALSEGIDLFNFDDNFTIPVLSSGFLYVVLKMTQKA